MSGRAFDQPAIEPRSPDAISEADRNATPFPSGRHAALVKTVCTKCHGADLVVGMDYTRKDAERLYRNMVSPDLSTDQAKQIIAYLTTHLGP